MQSDRDRFIELIKASIYGNIDEGFNGPELNCENVADYLLANGVIVPPCKVGDMVYIIGIFTGQFITRQVVAINYGESGLFLLLDSYTVVSVEEQLGKTVFLTKEEAEEKLKEMKDNA